MSRDGQIPGGDLEGAKEDFDQALILMLSSVRISSQMIA